MLKPDGRVAMISGPGRGIGRAIAQRLHADGYPLSLGGRNTEAIQSMVDEWDGSAPVSVHHFDGNESATAHQWVADTAAEHGGIDVLINNAGILDAFTLDTYDEEALDAMWQVNVKAPTLLTHLLLPYLRTSGNGRVINIASASGKRVRGGILPGYAMTKHAVMALTHATRQYGWSDGIRATAICPSLVGTEMIEAFASDEVEPVIQPEDIAELVSTALKLPNHSSVAEIAVTCRLEDTL